jgi:hypothetical protein
LLKYLDPVEQHSVRWVVGGHGALGFLALGKVGFVSGFCAPCHVLKIALGRVGKVMDASMFAGCRFRVTYNGYVLAMVGLLKNVSPTFVQIPNRITNVEFTTVSPTIANTMLN